MPLIKNENVLKSFSWRDTSRIARDTAAKLVYERKKVGSVADRPRSGRPRATADEGTTDVVLTNTVPCVWKVLGHPGF